MKTIGMLTLCALVAGLLGFAVAEERKTGDFELTVDGTVYPIDVDKPFAIKAPDGKSMPAMLRRSVRTWNKHGLRFRYPGDMDVSVKEARGRVLLMVRSPEAYFVQLQLYFSDAVEPQSVHAMTVAAVKQSLVKVGVVFGEGAATDSTRAIAGEVRKGTALEYALRNKEFHTELYTFGFKGKVLSVTLQHTKEQQARARKALDTILTSLAGE